MKQTMLPVALLLLTCVWRASAQVADSAAVARFWNEYRETAAAGGDLSAYWLSRDNLIEKDFNSFFNGREKPCKLERIEVLNDSLSVITLFNAAERPREWYKVGVLRRADGYKLVDYFQTIKGGLLRERAKHVDVYSTRRNAPDGRRLDRFIDELCAFYGFEPDRRIEYLYCSDTRECYRTAGLGFGNKRQLRQNKGMCISGTLVFTGRRYHAHELVHAVMIPKYPGAMKFLQEGLAKYHEGRAKRDVRAFEWHVDKAKGREYRLEALSKNLGTMSAAGSLLVDHVLKNHGPAKMLALMSYADLDEMLENEFGVVRGGSLAFFVSLLESYKTTKRQSKRIIP